MKNAPNELVPALQQILAPEGFTRHGASWVRAGRGIIQLVNLQKSSFGQQYYLNLGLWVQGEVPPPSKLHERDMHIRLRVDVSLPKADGLRLATALDLEGVMSPAERVSVIAETCRTAVLPWLNDWNSPESLGRAIRKAPLTGALVTKEALTLVPKEA